MDVAVRCEGVTKGFGTGAARVQALRGIDLDVFLGELLMIVGPSGSGKTTLLSVIAGILDQDEGRCTVLGRDLKPMPVNDKARFRGENIGFVFQSFNLIPTLTAAENVSIPLLIRRLPAERKAQEILQRVGLGNRGGAYPTELSGGEQQRVAIARAVIHEPKMIVCDEPTSSLDHDTGHRIMEILKAQALTGQRALVVVTHDARIFPFADRIASMDDGRIVKVEEP